MADDLLREDEEARERHFWGLVLRLFWIFLIALLLIGASAGFTLAFGWQRFILLSSLGTLAGLALALAGRGSARGRQLTGLVLGAGTLPLIALYLAGIALTDPDRYRSSTESLAPFLAHAVGAALGCLWMVHIWTRRPSSPPPAVPSPPAPEGGGS